MKTSSATVVLAAASALCAGAALADIRAIELAVETTAGAVVLPSAAPSSVVVTPCAGCDLLTLPTSAASQFFIGRTPVELAELKRRLTGKPNTFVAIIYDKKTRELRRLRAYLD